MKTWNDRGEAYLDLGQPDKAIADHSRAIELDPKYAWAWVSRGAAYLTLDQPKQTVADCSKAIELAPNEPLAIWGHKYRAMAYCRLTRFEEARTDYQAFLKRFPKHPGACNDLAWLLATCPDPKVRDSGRALEWARSAIKLAPKRADYWKTLGVAHYRAGDWKAAVAALDKFVELRPDGDAFEQLLRAMSHRKLGNHEEARKGYDQAVECLEKNKESLEKDKLRAEEIRRFRSEAEEVLELKQKN